MGCLERFSIQIFGNGPTISIQPKGIISSEEVAGTAEMPEIALESEICRLLLKVPFPGHRGEVAGVAKHLG